MHGHACTELLCLCLHRAAQLTPAEMPACICCIRIVEGVWVVAQAKPAARSHSADATHWLCRCSEEHAHLAYGVVEEMPAAMSKDVGIVSGTAMERAGVAGRWILDHSALQHAQGRQIPTLPERHTRHISPVCLPILVSFLSCSSKTAYQHDVHPASPVMHTWLRFYLMPRPRLQSSLSTLPSCREEVALGCHTHMLHVPIQYSLMKH